MWGRLKLPPVYVVLVLGFAGEKLRLHQRYSARRERVLKDTLLTLTAEC